MIAFVLGALLAAAAAGQPAGPPEWLGGSAAGLCRVGPSDPDHCPESRRARRRIVSLAPSFTEILFAVGAGERVVAVTRFDHEPPAVERLPKVGGFVDPEPEAVLALRPDLVVAAPVAGSRGRLETLAQLGATVLLLPAESIADLWQAIALLGRAAQAEQQAAALARQLQAELAAVASTSSGLPRLTVLLVVGYRPLIAAGPDSFLDSLLGLVNARNAVRRGGAFVQLDLEAVRAALPDVVVDVTLGETAPAGFWRMLTEQTTRAPRLVTLREEALLRPGPRLPAGLRALARALRPETAR